MAAVTIWLLWGGVLMTALGRVVWRRGRILRRAVGVPAWVLAGLLLAGGCYSYWYHHRPWPKPMTKELFKGIRYTRDVRRWPRPMVIHVVSIDLDAEGIDFLVTPGKPTKGRQLAGQTTSQFLAGTGVQLAVNAGGFYPWYAKGPFWYYPHAGDPVDCMGLTRSRGDTYSPANEKYPTVYIGQGNQVSIGRELAGASNAVSGIRMIVEDGKIPEKFYDPSYHTPAPRTAYALDASGRRLLLFVVDGRQPNYSEGATYAELAEIVRDYGGATGINMDGGGSSTLVQAGPDGKPVVLNSPIHGKVPPGRERPVATHLGVYAQPVGGEDVAAGQSREAVNTAEK